jgi:hypothetical protein
MGRGAAVRVGFSLGAAWGLLGCGLDGSGLLAPTSDASTPLVDGALPPPPPADAAPGADASGHGDGAVAPPGDAALGDAPAPPPPQDAATDAGTPFCDPSDRTLIVCFRFEGSVTDESSNAIVPMSSRVSYTAGVRGQAAVFTPPDGQIVLPNAPLWNAAEFTVEAWVNPTLLPGLGARAGVLDSDNRFGMFVYSPGTIDCITQNAHLVGPVLTAGQWTHVACTYDGTTVTLYVGGISRATALLGAPGSSMATTVIGGNSPTGDPFDGAIDELRVFSTARTAAQIAAAATP